MKTEILTETGTNEAEFLEFYLNDQSFAINVAKVVQIIPFNKEDVTYTSGDTETAITASLLWRDQTIDMVDLYAALRYREEKTNGERPVVLITSFNDLTCAFRIKGVNRIHRVNWNQIQPLDGLLGRYSPKFTGSITIGSCNILLVDFEKLISDLFGSGKTARIKNIAKESPQHEYRNALNIILAEDSNMIRNNMTRHLEEAGYRIRPFNNGQTAWDYLQKRAQSVEEAGHGAEIADLIITDIEMPQMDGLTFCRKIKTTEQLSGIPVVIFSSLINDQMALKCKEVGADRYLTKPRLQDLVDAVDAILINKD